MMWFIYILLGKKVKEMAVIYATLIVKGKKTIADVPVKIRAQVQEILIDLKGLYIGGYGLQPQIGTPYAKDATSDAYVSRMPNNVWQSHFKLLGKAKPELVVPIEFTSERDLAADCGKLMTIKNISIKGADGTVTWASKSDAGSGTSVSKYFVESPYSSTSKYMVYTSTYADFANTPIPTGKMNLTGIWKRYNNAWELVIRDINDIEVVQ